MTDQEKTQAILEQQIKMSKFDFWTDDDEDDGGYWEDIEELRIENPPEL